MDGSRTVERFERYGPGLLVLFLAGVLLATVEDGPGASFTVLAAGVAALVGAGAVLWAFARGPQW